MNSSFRPMYIDSSNTYQPSGDLPVAELLRTSVEPLLMVRVWGEKKQKSLPSLDYFALLPDHPPDLPPSHTWELALFPDSPTLERKYAGLENPVFFLMWAWCNWIQALPACTTSFLCFGVGEPGNETTCMGIMLVTSIYSSCSGNEACQLVLLVNQCVKIQENYYI